jgi:hypothetical protein
MFDALIVGRERERLQCAGVQARRQQRLAGTTEILPGNRWLVDGTVQAGRAACQPAIAPKLPPLANGCRL